MKKTLSLLLVLLLMLPMAGYSQNVDEQQVKEITTEDLFQPVADSITIYLKDKASINGKIKVNQIVTEKKRVLKINLSSLLGDYPIRDNDVEAIYSIANALIPEDYKNFKRVEIYSGDIKIEDLSSPSMSGHEVKKAPKARKAQPLVRAESRPYEITNGLSGKNLAVWQSHGWYYEQSLQRWEWQRARIFLTVEDLYTQSYVLPFLVPMLENAGANVLLPRERDYQINEVIVDNDTQESGYSETNGTFAWEVAQNQGFADNQEYYLYGENPFEMGSARVVQSVKTNVKKPQQESFAYWHPNIPESGDYAVYVSYQTLPKSTENAKYTVMHNGGETKFTVNQKMGGGTWIYLGTFSFDKGKTETQGVKLSNLTEKNKELVTADGVKFGGGMGNIARKPSEVDAEGNPIELPFSVEETISGYPRFTEGARYWLQYAGFADSVYSYTKNQNDYTDDYQSRGLWVNALNNGSENNPKAEGKFKIPIDLSFAFHTDAGTTINDSIIGTLAIFTRTREGSTDLPNGKDRLTSRDYTDLVQTAIVEDIRATYEPNWSRRGLWNRSYSESRHPQVPAMLLELLSHQNLADMRYGLDPSFRFVVSRAIYKGMLKYLAYNNDYQYVVQPLPVNSFSATLLSQRGQTYAQLSWKPTVDKLEATANPTKYVVYTSIEDKGWDNGVVVDGTTCELPIEMDKIYNFKVVAINDGGASFPSETLSVAASKLSKGTVLIINGFDRVSAPVSFATKDSTRAGFQLAVDNGVPYGNDISFIGDQHEYRRHIPWMDDDSPGFGASYGDFETKVVAGNTFDYPKRHGKAFLKLGYSFVSSSRDAVTAGEVKMSDYDMVDIIFGKQLTTMVGREGASQLKYQVFSKDLQTAITNYCNDNGKLLISGSNIATDIWDKVFDFPIDSVRVADVVAPSKEFAQNVLHWRWMTNYAAKNGKVKAAPSPYDFNGTYDFYTEMNEEVYSAESPDAINPVGEGAYTIFRYADNNISAGVAYDGDYKVVTLGFPIETIKSEDAQLEIIKEVCNFFEK